MSKDTKITATDIRRVYDLLEKIQDLFHQPLYYQHGARVTRFAEVNYDEIRDLYYNVVWEWLSEEVREQIGDGELRRESPRARPSVPERITALPATACA